MAKFGYLSRRQMEPRPGKNYATEYYKQSRAERRRTQAFVERVIQRIGELALETPGGVEAITEPLKKFRRKETQGAYSALDIMTDMLDQLESGKDIPSGMLGRWNRLLEPYGMTIDMVPEEQLPPPTELERLFEHVS